MDWGKWCQEGLQRELQQVGVNKEWEERRGGKGILSEARTISPGLDL